MGYRVAVVGATGNVGREMLNILAERQFPLDEVAAVASSRSTGDVIDFGDSGEELKVKNLEHFDFAGWDIALFAAGSEVSKIYAPKAAAAGCTVIDNSSLYRMDPDVPLIVPEVNSEAIAGYRQEEHHRQPELLDGAAGRRAEAAPRRARRSSAWSSRPTSRCPAPGSSGMDELFEQSRNIFVGDANEPAFFTKQIAFNVIPHIDVFLDDGSTKEEWKMVVETKKILDPSIKVTATCVRVPVFVGHSEAVNIEFENEISADQARDILREAPGVMVVDKREDGGYVTPVEARRRICDLRQPHPRGSDGRERAQPVGGQRQPAQGRGAQRGPDRRAARPQASAEGGLGLLRPSNAAAGSGPAAAG